MRKSGLVLCSIALVCCQEDPPPSAATCVTLGCPPGSTCEDPYCIADVLDDYRAAVRFEPNDDRALMEWTDLRLMTEIGTEESLRFDRVTLRGRVGPARQPLAALIELARQSPVPGRAPSTITHSVRAGETFAIHVPENDYAMTAWSIDPSSPFPPLRRTLARSDLNDDGPGAVVPAVEIEIPELVVVEGLMVLSNDQRVQNLRVVAIDPVSGEALSTSSVTGRLRGEGLGGEYGILLPATTGVFALRATETFEDYGRALPTMQFTDLDLRTLTFDTERQSYVIGRAVTTFSAVSQVLPLAGTVEGLPGAGGRVTIGDAILRFRSSDLGDPGPGDVAGTMDRVIRSEVEQATFGTYEVSLPAGTYDVDIIPPPDPEFADLASAHVVGQFVNAPDNGAQRGIVFEVPSRVSLGGTVVDGFGSPIADATIELRGGADLSDVTVGDAESYVRTVSARTSAEGAFLALVDPGHYDVVVQPPDGSGLPWAVKLGVEVLEDQTLTEPLVVSPGRRLFGTVREPDDTTPRATVEVWCVTETDASLLCGRTTTDGAGRYELLLPAELPAFD